jgi:hypothetical protein
MNQARQGRDRDRSDDDRDHTECGGSATARAVIHLLASFPSEASAKQYLREEREMDPQWIGAIVALLLATAAYLRSRARGGFYDAEVYGMTPSTHRAYALAALAFTVLFAASALARESAATIWLWAAFVLFAIFYLTSYLRGAHESDE